MDTARELDRLYNSGARFSISVGEHGGFLVRLGNYAREVSANTEASSIEEAVSWLHARLPLQRGH